MVKMHMKLVLPNIFGCPGINQTNIQMCSYDQELTDKNLNILNSRKKHYYQLKWYLMVGFFKYSNIWNWCYHWLGKADKTRPGDLVIWDSFGWLLSKNLNYFRPYNMTKFTCLL